MPDYPVDIVDSNGKRTHLKTNAKGEVHLASGTKGTMMLFAAVMTSPAANDRFVLNLSTLTFAKP